MESGGCGRYSICGCCGCCGLGSCQKPGTHCQPPRTSRHDPGTQMRPGGVERQNPLIQMNWLASSSQCQYPGIHWTWSPSGFWSGGSSSIGSGGCLGTTGVAAGASAVLANAS